MRRSGRLTAILLALGVLFVLGVAPAIGQEDTEEAGEAEVISEVEVGEPAVVVAEDPPSEPIPDWTYRYLIPTTLVLTAVVVLLTSIRYFTNVVRKRYRVVEE